ncbi:hypothetical protein LB504_003271 [Fusarium proliferatum]|nr:hypothetical protein LB504_003271 [Fusarium proliferatum]
MRQTDKLLCSSLLASKLQLQDRTQVRSASLYNHLTCLSSILDSHFSLALHHFLQDWTDKTPCHLQRPIPAGGSSRAPQNQRHSLIHTLIRHWVSGGSSFTIPLGQSVKHRDRCSRARQVGPSNSSVLGFKRSKRICQDKDKGFCHSFAEGDAHIEQPSHRPDATVSHLQTLALSRSPRILSWSFETDQNLFFLCNHLFFLVLSSLSTYCAFVSQYHSLAHI